jgi:hypothetical protein
MQAYNLIYTIDNGFDALQLKPALRALSAVWKAYSGGFTVAVLAGCSPRVLLSIIGYIFERNSHKHRHDSPLRVRI